jgi:UDP-N-acetylmuramoylalanine--D-glutamate ligase
MMNEIAQMKSLISCSGEVAILGGGVSGVAVQKLLQSKGKLCTIYSEEGNIFDETVARDCSFVVLSPGFSPKHSWIQMAKDAEKTCLSEIDLGLIFSSSDEIIAVTGTNGKTSLTGILTHISNQLNVPALSLGNIGVALCDAVSKSEDQGKLIFHETSSFQSLHTNFFQPDSAIWINFSPDHLDYHGTIEEYFHSKLRLIHSCKNPNRVYLGTSVFQYAHKFGIPLNPLFRKIEPLVPAEVPSEVHSFHRTYPQLENLGFAYAWFLDRGFTKEEIVFGLGGYQPEPHRLQKVGVINDVSFWNDSKSTNLASVVSACESFPKKVIWIGGGKNKGQEVGEFSSIIFPYLDRAYLIGQTAREIFHHLVCKGVQAEICQSLKEAVFRAFQNSQKLSHILFSPGFASFDMFKNYSDRGNSFNSLVFDLKRTSQATTK